MDDRMRDTLHSSKVTGSPSKNLNQLTLSNQPSEKASPPTKSPAGVTPEAEAKVPSAENMSDLLPSPPPSDEVSADRQKKTRKGKRSFLPEEGPSGTTVPASPPNCIASRITDLRCRTSLSRASETHNDISCLFLSSQTRRLVWQTFTLPTITIFQCVHFCFSACASVHNSINDVHWYGCSISAHSFVFVSSCGKCETCLMLLRT